MKSKIFKSSALICFILLTVVSYNLHAQMLKDINGHEYKTAKYGIQEWSASNLDVSKFSNGDIIPEIKTKEEWIKAARDEKPAWCNFNNDPLNGKKYGKLYNWYAINDARGLAPKGWRIPKNNDWTILVKNLLGIDYAGIKLKSITGWKSKNGVDKIGFSAIPGGLRDDKGDFNYLGTVSQWWSNSVPVEVTKSDLIYSIKINDTTVEVSYVKMAKDCGLSVRCIKDSKL